MQNRPHMYRPRMSEDEYRRYIGTHYEPPRGMIKFAGGLPLPALHFIRGTRHIDCAVTETRTGTIYICKTEVQK